MRSSLMVSWFLVNIGLVSEWLIVWHQATTLTNPALLSSDSQELGSVKLPNTRLSEKMTRISSKKNDPE